MGSGRLGDRGAVAVIDESATDRAVGSGTNTTLTGTWSTDAGAL
ncbi:MAG: hypothetical protein OXF41_20740 [bacterium]|nr:hypothetical protein [bacterium]